MFLFGTPDTTTSVGKKIPTLGDNDIFVTLRMKKVTLNASVYTRLQKERSLIKTKKVQYPVVRSKIRTYSFDGHSTRWEQDNVFVNRVPGKGIIGLMNSANYNGSLQHYTLAYQKFGVTRVRQTIDGEEYPYRSLELTGNTKASGILRWLDWIFLGGYLSSLSIKRPYLKAFPDFNLLETCRVYLLAINLGTVKFIKKFIEQFFEKCDICTNGPNYVQKL